MTTKADRLILPAHIQRGTPALNDFVNAQLEIVSAFFFMIELAHKADDTRVTAAKALIHSLADDDPDRARFEEVISKPDMIAKRLADFRRVTSENLVNNTVNAFNRYISDAVQACILKQPRILSSEDVVPVKSIIGMSDMKDVIRVLVERRVNKLSYGSLSDLSEYVAKHLGVSLFQDAEQEAWVRLAIEVRNINVHAGGIVNAVFHDRVKDTRGESFVIGKRHHTDWDLYSSFAMNLVRTAHEFDDAITKKFKLVRKKRVLAA